MGENFGFGFERFLNAWTSEVVRILEALNPESITLRLRTVGFQQREANPFCNCSQSDPLFGAFGFGFRLG